jgi:crossover junction endodeoxyribonuclease RuvC
MRILGIDPGYERLGIAVIEKNPQQKETLVYSECFKTSAKDTFTERLRQVGEHVSKIIETHSPEILAIETLFFKSNQKTAMNVAETRGVIMYEALQHNLTVKQFNPLEIKVAITSDGKADKTQVISMIPKLIAISKHISHDDEYDAIAVGLTCLAINHQNYRK